MPGQWPERKSWEDGANAHWKGQVTEWHANSSANQLRQEGETSNVWQPSPSWGMPTKQKEGLHAFLDGASATAAVLQAQADRLLEQSSLEARAMAGEFAEGAGQGAGRLGLWDHPADTHDTYVPNPTPACPRAARGAALGRIVGQVQTHNRLLQQDEIWRRHKEGKESSSAAAPSGGDRGEKA